MKRIIHLSASLLLASVAGVNAANIDAPAGVMSMLTAGPRQADIKVSGIVVDENDDPVAGATIRVKNDPTIGTSTDIDGKFKITVPLNTVLQVSFIGYKPQDATVTGPILNIRLDEDITKLDEVVVTALGIKRDEKALGYSTQKVSGEKLSQVKSVNVASSLTGKVAGLHVQNSTEFNQAPTLKLRGETPLLVVDGVPYRNMSLSDISPDDVESIDVLKGATASALYGARGASGAIMVTTRRGKEEGLRVAVNSSTMFNAGYLRMPLVQKAYSSGLNGKYNDNASYVWGARLDEGFEAMQYNPYTQEREMTPLTSRGRDNLKNFQETGFVTNNNVNVTYKGQFGSFRSSLTHIYNKGQFPNEGLNKLTYTVAGDVNFKNFTLDAGITYNRRWYPNMTNPAYDGGKSYLYQMLVWSGCEYDIRDYKNYWKVENQLSNWWDRGNWYENPYYIANEVTEANTYDVINAFANASYQITPWLKFSLRAGIDSYTSRSESKVPVGSRSGAGSQKGYYSFSRSAGFSTNNDAMLMADKTFGDFNMNGFVGGNIYYFNNDNIWGATDGGLILPGYYSLKASVDPAKVTKSYNSKQMNSLYGKIGFAYKSLAFIDITGRNDWSSTLPERTRSYFYPAVSGSFVPSEIIQMPSFFNFWKIRGAWTTTKTDMGIYDINDVYTISTDVWNNMSAAYAPGVLRNFLLSPSQRRSYEVGTAMSFLNGRLRFDYTYYNTLRYNNTRNASLSHASGFSSTQVNMDEEQLRSGMEITLSGDIIRTRDLVWSATLNWARDRYTYHKIDSLYSTQKPWVAAGERWDWIDYYDYQRDPEGNIIHDSTGLPLVNPFTTVKGFSEPDWTWGLNTTVEWKGFTLSVSFDGAVGGIGYSMLDQAMWNAGSHIDSDNQYRYDEVVNGLRNYVGKGVKLVSGSAKWDSYGNIIEDTRVFAPNDIEVSYQNYMMKTNPYASGGNRRDQNYFDRTFVKMRDLYLSYSLPASLCKKLPLNSASAAFVGQNLWMWSKEFRFSDPERVADALTSPSMRYLGFNIKLNF